MLPISPPPSHPQTIQKTLTANQRRASSKKWLRILNIGNISLNSSISSSSSSESITTHSTSVFIWYQLKVNLIDNYKSPEKFINELLQYKKIISSSLHGIIFSHSFNKEVIPIKITDKIIGGDFKFKDYYSSIGYYDLSRLEIPERVDEFKNLKIDNFTLDFNLIKRKKNTQLIKINDFLKSILWIN